MAEGAERRRNKRIDLTSRLVIKRLDSQDDTMKEIAIEVVNVSKTGLGFDCTYPLEIGAVYEAYLTIWTKEVIHAFVEIVRIVKEDDVFHYGSIFIGMPEMDAMRIQIYDTVNNADQEN
ncbi:MAG: PilZ domain-containing protein [Lachnospiraceae bacterium]|nr:PilZ domain-containing protein [Lachnospiraceae bacterium]